jgi:hypothetical protein
MFVVRAPEMETATRKVTLEGGKSMRLEFALKEVTPAGMLMVRSDSREASLKVDSKTHALPLDKPLELKPGRYSIEVLSATGARWSGNVDVDPKETTHVLVPLASVEANSGSAGPLTISSYVMMGAGAALLTGGFLMGSQASSTFDLLEQQQASLGAVDAQLVEQGQSQQTWANVLMITGGVSLAGGITLFVLDLL